MDKTTAQSIVRDTFRSVVVEFHGRCSRASRRRCSSRWLYRDAFSIHSTGQPKAHQQYCFDGSRKIAVLETQTPAAPREITVEILRSKHDIFTAAAGEITRRTKAPITAEPGWQFFSKVESDVRDIADIMCAAR